MNNTALTRIRREFNLLEKDPPENFRAYPLKVK
jgi:hypothetical protein